MQDLFLITTQLESLERIFRKRVKANSRKTSFLRSASLSGLYGCHRWVMTQATVRHTATAQPAGAFSRRYAYHLQGASAPILGNNQATFVTSLCRNDLVISPKGRRSFGEGGS